MPLPFVSVVTPTCDRREFWHMTIHLMQKQTYPKNRLEWIILDDGKDSIQDMVEHIPYVKYIRSEEKMLIGKKRNMLNAAAKGEYIISWDDDDYYPAMRISHAIKSLSSKPNFQLAGTSRIFMYYTDNEEIYEIGPYNQNHSTNGTFVVRKSFANAHTYDETVTHAEERSFLDDFKYPILQLDTEKTILVIAHTQNTFDKRPLRSRNMQKFELTRLKLKSMVKDKKALAFYRQLTARHSAEKKE